MGCDIHLYAEGFLPVHFRSTEKRWINIDRWYRQDHWADIMLTENCGFTYTNLIDNRRDYGLFYLLAGVRGLDDENSYPPISAPKGFPSQMDELILSHEMQEIKPGTMDCHHISWLTLGELRRSGYGSIMRLKGWVRPEEYEKSLQMLEEGREYQLPFVDVKDEDCQNDMILREWDGYLNLNFTYMMRRLETLKTERRIESDDEIRIVFWFDN